MEEEQEVKSLLRKQRSKFIFILIIVSLFVAVLSSEYTMYDCYKKINKEMHTKEEYSEEASKNIDIIAKNLKNFREKYIDTYYIGEIDEQKMLDESIKGYINGLGDEYSEYLTAKEWEDFQADALGNYVGIGIYMGTDKSGNVVVVAPIKGTPAEEAGLESGDIIVSVNEENALGKSADAVSSMIKGEEGTKVKIVILRENEYKEFEVERKAIKVFHVESEMLENNIGYILLNTFDEGCAEEFKEAYLDLKSKGAKKIIIDLRNNTGGIVDEALSILDYLLPKDTLELITIDSKGTKEYTKSKEDPIIDEDIVVLVNKYSASASEITVGALKDNGRAKIVGVQTFGKGVIQGVFTLNDGSALKLTMNEYYTPNEIKINKVGIEPDYVVELDSETEEDEQLNKAIELLK